MSLSPDDLENIKLVVRDEVEPLENDIKEIYFMLKDLFNERERNKTNLG